jgi:hypothetical protein
MCVPIPHPKSQQKPCPTVSMCRGCPPTCCKMPTEDKPRNVADRALPKPLKTQTPGPSNESTGSPFPETGGRQEFLWGASRLEGANTFTRSKKHAAWCNEEGAGADPDMVRVQLHCGRTQLFLG